MRPVNRGEPPEKYEQFQDAIGDLEDRLGTYCSYCERRLPAGLAVEHVVPKSYDEDRELDWSNFLLACGNCNSVKGKKITNDHDFVWPDRDNTLLGITYQDGGMLDVTEGLSEELKGKVKRLIDLVGLDRHPGQPRSKRPTDRDRRYMQREQVWRLAKRRHETLARMDCEDLRSLICDLAVAEGFFSVWMLVFHDDTDMRKRFAVAFTGTSAECFDHDWKSIPRPGGKL